MLAHVGPRATTPAHEERRVDRGLLKRAAMTALQRVKSLALLAVLSGCGNGADATVDVPTTVDVSDGAAAPEVRAPDATPADVADANPLDAADVPPPDVPPSDVPPPDVSPMDVPDARDVPTDGRAYDAGPYACGSMTCGANQVCVHPCSGVDSGHGGPPPLCVDVPTSCDGTPSCDCVRPAACSPFGGAGGCSQRGARDLYCDLCA